MSTFINTSKNSSSYVNTPKLGDASWNDSSASWDDASIPCDAITTTSFTNTTKNASTFTNVTKN